MEPEGEQLSMKGQKWSLLVGPSIDQLMFIVQVLNSDADGTELRKLVEAWQNSGPDLRTMLRTNKVLAASIKRSICYLEPYGKGGKLVWMPRTAGKGELGGKWAAISMFVTLVVHPQLDKFAGPCSRCSKFYLKNSARQKVYCSRSCGARQNALQANRKRRAKQHHDKLVRAQIALETWRPSAALRDWKTFVAAKTGLTSRFLTRAVNNGQLIPPEGHKESVKRWRSA